MGDTTSDDRFVGDQVSTDRRNFLIAGSGVLLAATSFAFS
ncbi:hypothetical protein C4J95_2745 [Pseudomonas orientalis]|nr:hypothetical protein C4J96_2637 [Pseudomonas orientalis]AZF00206.1 hypothetical protein C4J95_2745 [Pseudomonas orientalis]